MSSYDVVIVGGGAAGLSAALVLARARRSVVVIDAGQPRNAPAARMHGFLGSDGLAPAALLAAGRRECLGYGAQLIAGAVTAISGREDPGPGPRFDVALAGGAVLSARRVLVGTGLRDELPGIPGLRERWGRDVLHCPYCHGYEVADRPLGVIGGTGEAVWHAHLVRQWSDDVIYFADRTPLSTQDRDRFGARGIAVVEDAIARLVVERDRLTGVELVTGRFVPRAAVFVRPRVVPNADLLARLGCASDQGWVVTSDPSGRTSVPGVWVAGNAVNPRAQVITAAGEGSTAAIAINNDLVEEDVTTAVAGARSLPH